MAIYNKQTKCTTEQLLDLYPKKDTLFALVVRYLYGIIRFLCIIIQNLYCISSYFVLSWIVLLPIGWLRSDLYSKFENCLYNSLTFIVSSWSLAAGIAVIESGDEYKHLVEGPQKYDSQQHKQQTYRVQPKNKLNEQRRSDSNVQLTSSKTSKFNVETSNGVVDKSASKFINSNTKDKQISTTSLMMIKSNRSTTIKTRRHKFDETNEVETKSSHSLMLNGHGDSISENQNGLVSIENQTGLASAAGERKLIQRNSKTDVNVAGIDSLRDLARKYNTDKRHNSNAVHTSNGMNNAPSKLTGELQIITTNVNSTLDQSLKSMQAKPRILFLCNHISTADVPLIMQSFSTLTNQSLMWVLDAQFKLTNFGVVCSSHGDFFVAKNSFVDGSLREQVLRHPDRNMLILFPEGGFLRKRIEGSNRYATKNGYPLTKYVTHPRFGAFKDLIDPSVGVTHIVDATLIYDDIKNPLSILDIVLGTRREPVILHYKLYGRDEINPTEEWLRNIWLEKDKLLTKYYENRDSLLDHFKNTLRGAKLDWFKVLVAHLFYLLVASITCIYLFFTRLGLKLP